MPLLPLHDMVVILPGIMGSVLAKDGKELWNVSGKRLLDFAINLSSPLRALTLMDDDPHGGDLGDGVKPTGLIQDSYLIPGFSGFGKLVDGYNRTSALITDNFQVVRGNIYDDPEDRPANFYHFPYDWRRDNRANARILKRLLDRRLHCWRKFSDNPNAKIILLAHSMGGLISRYYLEVLGGWQDCRTLFTFGTPYRGSIHAIDALANGLRKGSINFGELLQLGSMIQSLNSIYQLMPRYKALQVGSTYYRVAESPVPLPNIDPQKAADALAFHNEIDDAADANQANPLYRQSFVTCPVVGVNQPTLQSAKLVDGQIQVSEELPVYLGDRPQLATGDGTVPQVSATPVQMTDLDLVSIADYISESHGALQIQPDILLGILSGIQALQTPTLEDVRGAMESVTRSTRSTVSGICLSTEDVYWTNEAITARATVTGEDGGNTLAAEISSVDDQSISFTKPLKREENQWSLTVDGLKSGLYKITVKPNQLSDTITPVHSIFEVIDPLSLEANHG